MIPLTDRTPTLCDTDPVRQSLLASALTQPATITAANNFEPDDAPTDWKPGVFELAAAVRQNLPTGLDASDFDGVNVQAALQT